MKRKPKTFIIQETDELANWIKDDPKRKKRIKDRTEQVIERALEARKVMREDLNKENEE